MGAPGYTTALRAETFQNLQLNAGMFVKNFDYSTIADKAAMKTALAAIRTGASGALGTLIGATRGGGSFTVVREMRQPEADGRRYGFVGDTYVDSVDAQISTTIIEITVDNLKDAFGSADVTGAAPKQTMKLRTAIDTDDYLTNICWIGDLADGRYVLICLKNPLNQADFSMTWTDKGEGEIPVEFHAKQAEVDDYDYAPFELVWLSAT